MSRSSVLAVVLLSLPACAPPGSVPSDLVAPATAGVPSLPPAGAAGPEVLGRVDYGWTVRARTGEVVPMDRFRGRPLFVNVWATWCPPCIAEMGSIHALMASLEGTEVAFLLVSPEDLETVLPFLDRLGYPLPAAVEHTRMPEAWGVRALPTTVVVDGEGRIVLRHRGAADWDQDAVRAFLRQLAADSWVDR